MDFSIRAVKSIGGADHMIRAVSGTGKGDSFRNSLRHSIPLIAISNSERDTNIL
jgi:hypothetical protein